MTYAVQTPLNQNYTWNGSGEITLEKKSDGFYKIGSLYLKNEDEYILDMTDSLDGLLFTKDRDAYFNIVQLSSDIYPKSTVAKY